MLKESILYIGIAQSIFAAFVLGTRQRVFIADRILIICLLTIAVRFLLKILSYGDMGFSASLIPMSFGPYMFLYTKYLIGGDSQFDRRDYLHFSPVVLVLVLHLVVFKDSVSFNEVTFFEKDTFLWARMLFGLVFFTSVLVYTIFTFQKLTTYRKELKSGILYQEGGQQLIWLNFVALLFSSLFVVYVVVGGINALTFTERIELAPVTNIGLTTLAYAFSYFGLRQPSIFGDIYNRTLKGNGTVLDETKSRFTPEQANDLVVKLEHHMKTEKPYLNPEITLSELAKAISITKYDLTHLLNDIVGRNFFSYINEYRLNDVIQRLEDPQYNHLTIMSIAYECGFKAKSTFNGLFKQYTGLTPTAYKRQKPAKVQMN